MASAADSRDKSGTWALIAVFVAFSAGLCSTASAKKKAPKVSATQAAFDSALDKQKPAIVSCVMQHGISQGAPSVKLEIKVLINRTGQVFGTDLQVSQVGGDQGAMTECIKQTLNLAQFPPSRSALTELRRVWTFSATH